MIENLQKASDGLSMVRDDLVEAVKNGDGITRLYIMGQMPKIADLSLEIDRLIIALTREDEE
jgi:hypothetical protein